MFSIINLECDRQNSKIERAVVVLTLKTDCNLWLLLVLYQEIWNSPYSNDSFPVYAEDIEAGKDASPSTAMLSEVARTLNITIVGGSIPERCGDKLYNTCCVFDTDGKLKAKHRKVVFLYPCIP